ncbi:MAG: DUF2851 family protein [Verrucomicrobiota bacterium]
MGVPGTDSNFYARWREQNEARLFLGEREGAHPPEQLLQSIWLHQRLRREQLQTLDGQPLRVLHPGFWNRAAGPDFRGAVLQFGQEPARTGDVEIDWVCGNWQAHGHQGNPAFAGVILHVVWNGAPAGAHPLPALALEKFVDTPLGEIQRWAGTGEARDWPAELQGACSGPLAGLTPEQAGELLQQAARVRFERKARELEARAREAGWEQALWEGLFRALGYKQNIWPMQRVGELLPRLQGLAGSVPAWQARLLGVAGLLPADIPSAGPAEYLRSLWDHWWRERESLSDVVLPRNLWRFNGLRPANQPQRRLALAAHWLSIKDFLPRLERWFTEEGTEASAAGSLLACLQAPEDDFWSWHWGLRSPRLAQPQPLLGATRVTDLAVNVILPWFWMRARAGRNEPLWKLAEARFLAWPAAQDNALLRLARRRMLGGSEPGGTGSAARQQGLLQIVHDFCDHSNAVCADCHFPDLVRGFV